MTQSTHEEKSSSRSSIGFGLGLRHPHMTQVLAGEARVDWFEIISENYMNSKGRSLYDLQQVAERYPLVFHGVSLSIGSCDPLNFDYLKNLKTLTQVIEPEWVSDHLCWTGINGINSHDLLPVPLNEETLNHITTRVNQVQDYLGRQLVLENPSTYMTFNHSNMEEPEFLKALVDETDCGLLLDVNNVFVSSFNAGKDPFDYFNDFPFDNVVQMHLAGHQDCGTHLIDTHDQPVRDEVWRLFQFAWQQTQGVATCLEWDGNIPSLVDCEAEIFKAKNFIKGSQVESSTLHNLEQSEDAISTPNHFMVPQVMSHITDKVS
ncbi:DUF692 domain-containing protein [Pleionea sediminis]|uniref:MNIO family bufferin maturase n=1 Tax=Pleionea sediminis TaxID=2569479 RepID=UPI00118672FA|nr:DUF692 domain-containing protein [Pleionea sediminis]